MTRPDIELPDDVEALKAMVLAMAEKAARVEALEKQVDDLEARNADADERIERLTQILKALTARASDGVQRNLQRPVLMTSSMLLSLRRSRPVLRRSGPRLRVASTKMANVHRGHARALRRIWSVSRW